MILRSWMKRRQILNTYKCARLRTGDTLLPLPGNLLWQYPGHEVGQPSPVCCTHHRAYGLVAFALHASLDQIQHLQRATGVLEHSTQPPDWTQCGEPCEPATDCVNRWQVMTDKQAYSGLVTLHSRIRPVNSKPAARPVNDQTQCTRMSGLGRDCDTPSTGPTARKRNRTITPTTRKATHYD